MLQHPVHRALGEQVGAALEDGDQSMLLLGEGEIQIELRGAALGEALAQVDAPRNGLALALEQPVDGEHHREQGRAAGLLVRAQGRDELSERHVLMIQGLEHRAPGALEQGAEAGPSGGVGAQHERIGEEPDERLQLAAGPAGDGSADEQVRLSGVAVEQDLEGGQEDDEEGRLVLSGQRPEFLTEFVRKVQGPGHALAALEGRPGPIRGQLQEGQLTRQRVEPVAQGALLLGSLHEPSLPAHVIRVLDGQWRQSLRPARDEQGQLAHEDGDGGAIGDDVVDAEDEGPLLLFQLDEREPHQRRAHQIEGALLLGGDPSAQPLLLLRGREGAQVHHRHAQVQRGQDVTVGHAPLHAEHGAQRIVPPDDLVHRALHRLGGERTRHAGGAGQVVGRAVRLQLVQEPQPLLRERQRELSISQLLGRRRQGQGIHARVDLTEDLLGHRPEGRPRQQQGGGQLDPELRVNQVLELHGPQRVQPVGRQGGIAGDLKEADPEQGGDQALERAVHQRLGFRLRLLAQDADQGRGIGIHGVGLFARAGPSRRCVLRVPAGGRLAGGDSDGVLLLVEGEQTGERRVAMRRPRRTKTRPRREFMAPCAARPRRPRRSHRCRTR